MKVEIYKQLLQKLKQNGKILFSNNKFYFQGIDNGVLDNFDDLLIKGNLKTKKSPSIVLFRRKQKEEVNNNQKECNNLLKRIENSIDDSAITSIVFGKDIIKDIKNVIREKNSTHLRLYNDENEIKISLFDYRQFITRTRILRQKSVQIFNLPTSEEKVEIFSKTFSASSFNILPTKDLWVRINRNNVISFTDEDTDTSYLLSEQEVNEPICNFINTKINKPVTFIFTNLSEQNIDGDVQDTI
jgi:hypothetical protein